MTWKSRGGEFSSRSFISQKWTLFLCLGSFCAGMLFTNRIWSIPEQNGLARPTAAETGKMNVVSDGCNSRILQEMEMRRETRDMYGDDFKGHNSAQALDKTISNLEMDLAAARAVQESVRSGSPVSEDIRTTESSGKRKYLMVVGDKRKKLEEEKGIVIRFVIGHSATSGGILDRAIEAEDRKHGDFLRLNHVEGYLELSAKTKTYFATAVNLWDADFYVKVDDDVHVNIATLGETLVRHRSKQRIYIGCMKSGPVLAQKGVRYHEPEHWKFGESGNKYFRHATGQLNVLHKYANEDVSIGAWFIGLDVEHIDDRRLCCGTPPDCEWKAQAGNICVASFDWSCSGICRSAERIKEVHKRCGEGENALWSASF
ncbi:putative beta-galactosyltransferase 2-like protein [Trifolium pratense]|uniref:Hexosyltransferase n=1 Tax=Trifolium pratense TaxID=57577 RepID=A0A2K3NRY3_TRIPR|nr:putative beta-galactosyltransferase 2-like protein [Trifolium pratense]